MDKRLAKRHKRQVARAKMNVKTSEPDVRTPEQIKADREASRPDASSMTNKGTVGAAARTTRSGAATSTGSAAKTAV
jgi:hypothetical protein